MEATKACSQCGEVKPLASFTFCRRSKDLRKSECRDCGRQRSKQYRDNGKYGAARRANPMATQMGQMITSSKARAKKKGLDHNIDVAYLRTIAPLRCPYLGIELRWKVQDGLGIKSTTFPNSPSLDRIDSSKGYIKGNVIIVSHRANAIKRDATELELITMGRRIAALKMNLAMPE